MSFPVKGWRAFYFILFFNFNFFIDKELLTSIANPCLRPLGRQGKLVPSDSLLHGGDTCECMENLRLRHEKHSRTLLIVK